MVVVVTHSMRILFVGHIIILVLIWSCDSKKEIKNISEPKTTLSESMNQFLDTLESLIPQYTDSLYKFYYPTGELWAELIMKNGKPDSFLIEYYKSGRPKLYFEFKDERLAYGPHGEYFDKNFTQFYIDATGDTMAAEGPQYKTFYWTNSDGKIVHQRNYDFSGNPISSKGQLITKIKPFKPDSSKLDSTIWHFYLVGLPYKYRYDDLRRHLRLIIEKDGHRFFDDSLSFHYDENVAFHLSELPEPGLYDFKAIARYDDILFKGMGKYEVEHSHYDSTFFKAEIK